MAAMAFASAASAHEPSAGSTMTEHSAPSSGPPETPDESHDEISALGVGAALFPGIIIHGSGHYVAGDEGTAKTLVWAELAGISLVALALLPAPIVGAHPYVVPFSALSAMTGVMLFGGSWLFDVYSVLVPPSVRGVPQRRPSRLESFVGYRYVYDPIFEYRHFLAEGFELWLGQFRIAPRADLSPNDANARYRALAAWRLWGATPDARSAGPQDGSFVDVNGGLTHHRFVRDGFDVSTAELSLSSRLDMRRVDVDLRGTFVEWGAGLGISRYRYRAAGAGNDDNGMLLMNFALGAYIGNPARRGGEARLYYDHRHDDFAAGTKLTGLGSGALGHFGADLRYYVSPSWGGHADFQVGSAYVTSFSVLYRPERIP